MKETLTADHRETLTIPGNLNSLVGEANVREFFETIAALPNLKSITGYFTSIHHCYLQHKEGIVPRKVLGAFCAGRPRTTYKLNADICDKLQLAELSVSDYFTTVIPLLPEVTDVWVSKTKITTLDWCAALPERIRRVDIDYCPNIQDCTPLLKMKGLKQVWFNSKTNSSFNAVKEQLRGKGVTCKMPG
ncbi:hypothetical protein AGDE_13284 [Angomonas deanei]|uniref:Leucine Rich repeat n=1 Tax=Angomonas deanei TaxID=59799 RepID=A0A7G2C5M0_9TRYP|nr:hypothetical protein AGDE_13284 [Angomonas deanei]CAD2214454.1 hypothetical protein, conserved [Angomonas deanei]|eukprot:EPY22480.1 hypothetical protein AGDE_13284 [Angomonas deanei]